MIMKKRYLFITFLLLSCTTNKVSNFDSIPNDNSSESDSYVESSFESESSENVAINEIYKIDEHHVIYKTQNKEIEYYADYIIDDEKMTVTEENYENSCSNQVCFLVINHGSLVFKDVSFFKDGDAYDVTSSLQYGKNSLVTLINESTVTFSNCAVNIFATGSSMIHLMDKSSALVEDVDVTIVNEYSYVFSYYNSDNNVLKSNTFICFFNEKSEESIIFTDEY